MDAVARETGEEVVAQIGFIEDPPKHIRSFSYLNYTEIQGYFQEASMIIGHCGVGTVIQGLTYRKPIVLVPRSKILGEHIDDHQFELADKLRGMEGIFVVDRIEDLKQTILDVQERLKKGGLQPQFSGERTRLLSFIKKYVDTQKSNLPK
jgi:UDP-N-acetylglucosamine transferase subunit ALG13